MSTQTAWTDLATSLELSHFGRDKLPEVFMQTIAGISRGFPVSIAQAIEQRRAGVIYLLRFPEGSDIAQIKANLPVEFQKKVSMDDGNLMLNQRYIISLPSNAEISETFLKLRDALASSVQPPSGVCERCSVNQGEFHLSNGYPMQLCATCVSAIQTEQRESMRAYEEMEVRPLQGTMWGVLAALIGGIAWGLVGYAINRFVLLVAILIGYLVAWAIRQGMGKVTRFGQVLTVILTLAGVFWGDLLMVTLIIAKEYQQALSLDLFLNILEIYPSLIMEAPSEILFSLFFGIVGALYALRRFHRKPKPVIVI